MDKRLKDNLSGISHDYVAPFFWLHWEDDKYIVNEIERIYQAGMRSVCLESRTHDDFCRDGWWEDVELILSECKKRDMKVWILDDKHFPSGYANGIFEDKPQLHPWGITENHMSVPGPVTDGCVISDIWLETPEDELVSVVAVEQLPCSDKFGNRLIDLTDGVKDGMLYFDLPEGLWQITFIVKTRRGIAPRFVNYCDKLNPECIKYYIQEVYQSHYDRFAGYFGNTFLGFFADEPGFRNNSLWGWRNVEFGLAYEHHPWHDLVLTKLIERNGIETRKMLAGLWCDVEGVSEKIRYDFMDIITDEYRNNFINPLADWCHDHGVMYIGHIIEDNNQHARTGNGPGHYFRSLDKQDMSGIDVVLHQIMPGLTECRSTGPVSYHYMNFNFFNYSLAKLGSSFAHIDERKQGRAMCEIFGAYGWAEGTKIMKYLMDHMLVRGINYFVPHAFSPKPNDPDCPPNFYDTGRNPQYRYFGRSMDYMQRMCHILTGGVHINSCAILYDAENIWLEGDRLPMEDIAKKLYDNLLDFDIIPEDYLGRIDNENKLCEEKYNLLLVPYSKPMSREIINLLKGVNIPVVMVTEGECDDTYGFEAVQLDNLVDYITNKGLRDISSDYEGKYLRFFHTVRDGKHIFMFCNEDIHNTINAKVEFGFYNGSSYIEYDAFENKAVRKTGDVVLSLAPYNSTVLVFDEGEDIPDYVEKVYIDTAPLDCEWTISLARENNPEFEPYTTTDRLINITGRDGIGDFSGHMKYEGSFVSDNVQGVEIDFGYVGEAMELFINGISVGKKQFPPYSFDISDAVVEGENKITAIVTNHNGYSRRDGFSKFVLMEPSGITGPVVIKKYIWAWQQLAEPDFETADFRLNFVKMLKNIKGAIFDMDGTLVDSLMLWDVLWKKFGKEFLNSEEFRPFEEDDKIVRTMTLRDAMYHIHSVYNIGDSGEELLKIANELIINFYSNDVELKKGVSEFLEYCYAKGIVMCIASATDISLIKLAVEHLKIGKYFKNILSCAEIGKGKDQPDIYLNALDSLGTSIEETCVFEDSHIAIDTADKIEMKTVGIYDKYNYGQEEIKKIATVYIADGETLEKLIAK